MNFLVDAQLPASLCRWLRDRGHEADYVATIMPGDTPDAAIAAHATTQGLVLVTKDEDFASRFPPEDYHLLWLRCGNSSNAQLYDWLEPRWPVLERMLASGERLIEVR